MNEKINKEAKEIRATDEEINKARTEIMYIRQNTNLLGANDYEMSAIEKILNQLEKKEILPKVAVERAGKILISKQDYH